MTAPDNPYSTLSTRPLSIESDVILDEEETEVLNRIRHDIARAFRGTVWKARVYNNNRFPERVFQVAFRFEIKEEQKHRTVLAPQGAQGEDMS